MNAMSPIPPLKTVQLPQILARLSDESEKAGWTEVKGNTGILELGGNLEDLLYCLGQVFES